MPKSFTEDGAAGAGESGGTYNPNTVGGFQGGSPINDGGMTWGGAAVSSPATGNGGAALGTTPAIENTVFGVAAGAPQPGAASSAGFMFARGGEVEGADEQFGFDPMAAQGDLIERLAAARATVQGAIDFGRKQNGLEQLAGLNRMPTVPGNQSESGAPRERPFPRLGPTQNPFGRRAEGALPDDDDAGADEPVGFNPSQSETGVPRPMPSPGPLPPAPVPFGKRRQFSESEEAPDEQVASAIPEEDTEETA